MLDKKVVVAILITYLVISFMPSLSLMSLLGKGKKKSP